MRVPSPVDSRWHRHGLLAGLLESKTISHCTARSRINWLSDSLDIILASLPASSVKVVGASLVFDLTTSGVSAGNISSRNERDVPGTSLDASGTSSDPSRFLVSSGARADFFGILYVSFDAGVSSASISSTGVFRADDVAVLDVAVLNPTG